MYLLYIVRYIMYKLFSILNYLFIKNYVVPFFFWGGAKITPLKLNDDNDVKTKRIKVESDFYILTQNIRNSQILTNDNIDFIEKLERDKLIELIKLYNLIIINLTDFIKKYLH